jgi:hypothetical protein
MAGGARLVGASAERGGARVRARARARRAAVNPVLAAREEQMAIWTWAPLPSSVFRGELEERASAQLVFI